MSDVRASVSIPGYPVTRPAGRPSASFVAVLRGKATRCLRRGSLLRAGRAVCAHRSAFNFSTRPSFVNNSTRRRRRQSRSSELVVFRACQVGFQLPTKNSRDSGLRFVCCVIFHLVNVPDEIVPKQIGNRQGRFFFRN